LIISVGFLLADATAAAATANPDVNSPSSIMGIWIFPNVRGNYSDIQEATSWLVIWQPE
jgi:hypothetical protein